MADATLGEASPPPPPTLAEEVREGLTRTPKRLSSRLLYDARGSELFEQITALPEYYLTRTELGILEAHAPEMLELAGKALTVIELGAGSAFKTQVILGALLERQPEVTFYPVDVSAAALGLARESLAQHLPRVSVRPLLGRYGTAIERMPATTGRRLVLFIGSSIGNFDPEDGTALLRDVADALSPGDSLLLGTDLRKSPELMVPAYDDAAGVTAEFNKNLLRRLNRELGGDFDPAAFRHVALWNEGRSRMEMHLESLVDQQVQLSGIPLTVRFAGGERLHTECSYKYTEPQVRKMLEDAGLRLDRTWRDGEGWFGVHLARVTR